MRVDAWIVWSQAFDHETDPIASTLNQGGLKNLYETWRTQLIKSMALIEALIDFGEDENIEDDVYDNGMVRCHPLLHILGNCEQAFHLIL